MSRSLYQSTLPVEIQERIRNIENIYKIANVKLTPVNKSYPLVSSESPRVEIYLPSDSVLDLENSILEAELWFNHRGNADANSPNNYVQSVYPPRYGLASLIEEINVYINGILVSGTKRYGFIHNWVKDWLQNFDVDINTGLNDCRDPSMLYSYPSGGGMAGRVVPRRGYPASAWNDPAGGAMNDINARLRNYYHMNLGESVGFFGEGSSKIINTAILGEVKLEFVFTSQIAACVAGSTVTAGNIYANTVNKLNATLDVNTETKGVDAAGTTAAVSFARNNVEVLTGYRILGDTGIVTLGNQAPTRTGNPPAASAIAAEIAVCNIANITLHIAALQFKGSEYYDVMNRLVDSGAYKYHFKRYVLQTDTATTTRQIDYRLVVNSECLNFVAATFRPNGYDTIANPVITHLAAQTFGHTGTATVSFDNQVAAGLPYTFNNSKFFCRSGHGVKRLGWRVDEVYYEPRTKQEMYIDNLRHWRNYVPGIDTKPHKGLKNIYDFDHCYFTGLLSFEVKSEDDVKYVYPLRGLNTNGKAVAISCFTETETMNYTAQAGNNWASFANVDLAPANAAVPTFLVCTTSTLNLMGKRQVDIRY